MVDRRGRQPATRRYPRIARVNEVLREVIAEELELLQGEDTRLGLLTVTAVSTERDLRRATVFLSSIPAEAAEALDEHRVRIQAAIGRQVRLKNTPQLAFVPDPAVETGLRVEQILRELRGPDDE